MNSIGSAFFPQFRTQTWIVWQGTPCAKSSPLPSDPVVAPGKAHTCGQGFQALGVRQDRGVRERWHCDVERRGRQPGPKGPDHGICQRHRRRKKRGERDRRVWEPGNTRRNTGEKIDDASITAQVKGSLLARRSTSMLSTKVTTNDGVVTVSGTAKNEAEKALVTKLVTDVNGVQSVVNKT